MVEGAHVSECRTIDSFSADNLLLLIRILRLEIHPSRPVIHTIYYVLDLTCSTEVERAIDNLVKSGKLYGPPGRREFIPTKFRK